MGYQILYYFDHYNCCELKTNDQETFKNHLFENVFQARIPLTLYCNGKILTSNTLPCSPSVIRVQTPLLGGKGGFGANLRRQAHNRVQKTSINLGSCRDLNGNRMKYVNAAIAMKRWRETMEKYQSLMDEGKEAEAKEYMKEASKQGINGWYAEIPSWFDGVKTVKHDELRAQLKAKMCKDWLRAREGRQPPKGAPSYWGCPRGKHCPYAHGHEELIGEGKREYEKEQEAKKNAEITEKMNNYMDYSSTTEEQMSNSVSNGMKLALENRKRRKVEKQNRTVNSRMNTLLNPTLLRKMPPLLSRKSPTPSEPVKETKQVETISVQDSLFNNKLNILEGNATINEDGIITGTSSFCSIRLSNTVIISGLYYFEVHILTDGLIQIGWADSMFVPNEQESNGVGDDDHSWSYDGIRQQKWFNGESTPYGEQWKVGDVIGCMIDADKRTIQYTLNGKLLKPAFEDFQHFGGVFPVCSLEEEESILVNLGQCQFEYDIPYGYKSLWELSPIMS